VDDVTTHRRANWLTARSLLALSALLLLIGAGCGVAGLRVHRHPLAGPVHRGSTSLRRAPSVTTVPPTAAVARSAPVTLRIPAIGLSVSVSTLGLKSDGTVEVPTDAQVPGWFRLGPSPGQVGSAVILGHVDSHAGPAVFYQLRALQPGNPVEVSLADGVVARFMVTSVVMYPKSQFPGQQVYGSHGSSALQLVTCGGSFDSQTGHYLSNVVVYTSFVGATSTIAYPTPASATSQPQVQ
jgi:hypothetical protein